MEFRIIQTLVQSEINSSYYIVGGCSQLSVVDFEHDGDEVMETVIEVSNIPDDCSEDKLKMILESRRITGASEARVIKVQFADGNHGQAVVTFSSPKGID